MLASTVGGGFPEVAVTRKVYVVLKLFGYTIIPTSVVIVVPPIDGVMVAVPPENFGVIMTDSPRLIVVRDALISAVGAVSGGGGSSSGVGGGGGVCYLAVPFKFQEKFLLLSVSNR